MFSIQLKVNGNYLYMCRKGESVSDRGVAVEFLSREYWGGKWRLPKNIIRVPEEVANACLEELLEQDKGLDYKVVRA